MKESFLFIIMVTISVLTIVYFTNYTTAALSKNPNTKEITLSLLIKDTNGTEVMRIPLNATHSGNATNVGPTMDVTIKNQNGENLISSFHVQTGCEMGGPLHGCVLK